MNPILVIARLTFRESTRRRIVTTALILGVAFLLIFSIGFYMITTNVDAVGGQKVNPVIRTETNNGLMLAGLYAVTFLSIAMAALLASDTMAGEISSGTIQTVVTKPVRRSAVVLGKWLGFAGLLGLYQLLMGCGVALSVYLQTGYTAPHMLFGIALIYLESLLIMSVALLCSCLFSSLATGSVVFGLYGLAFIGGWVEQIGAILHSQTAIQVGIVTSLIIPSEALWRRASFEMQTPLSGILGVSPFGTTSVPSPIMIAYALVYTVLAVWLAVRAFNSRDL